MSFSADLKEFENLTQEKQVKVLRQSSLDVFSSIVLATPVLQGVLRNAWFVSMGAPSSKITDEPGTPSAIISRIDRSLTRAKLGQDIYFTNNLPYAEPIEYDGHSAKAPNGMVRINTGRWDTIVANNTRAIA